MRVPMAVPCVLKVEVVIEFECVHNENHSDKVGKGLCARVSGKCRQASIPSLCGTLV